MNEELPTQVDEACEDTSDRKIPWSWNSQKICEAYRSHSVVIYVENFTILQILYNNLYKVHKTKEEHCHCWRWHTHWIHS